MEKKGTTQKNRCASKSQGVNHEGLGRFFFLEKKKKTENKQNDNALKVIRMHENIQAAESLIQRLFLSLCSIGALMRGKQKWEKLK